MNRNDPKLDHWAEVLALARSYAAKGARRHFVACDAHVPGGGFVREGKLLLDFHTFPLRIEEVQDKPKEAQLRVGYTDAIYGRSKGGITPSGWRCEHLPYLVEFDNYGRSRKPGEAGQGKFWVWGWDEITWFSQQSENYRNEWLRYAWRWVRETRPRGLRANARHARHLRRRQRQTLVRREPTQRSDSERFRPGGHRPRDLGFRQ